MKPLADLVREMDAELRTAEVPDYPNALNGLQLASTSGEVRRIASAVDACLPVIRQAVERGCDLLLVHHGLFWQGLQRLEGPAFDKLRVALEGGLAVYASHIPLDVHPRLGNNIRLCRALRLPSPRLFFSWKGIQLGLRAAVSIERSELLARAQKLLGPVHLCPGGPERVRNVGVITGGAGGEVAQAAREGIDTFLTGEGAHWTYPLAEELGVNLIYGGHYATETFGVQALGDWLARRHRLPHEFIDHPSGL